MRVLITNTRLEGRGGTETFVRQLARGLQAHGHSAIAYGSDPKELPRLLESDVIPVATDLERLPFRPDIIHAQHHLDAMTAITALPGVPAIYHCHGAIWRESVPKHPRIHHYLLRRRLRIRPVGDRSHGTIAVNSPAPCAGAIGAELDRYAPDEAAAVSARARHEADFDRLVESLIPVYEQAVARNACAAPGPTEEILATSRYLRGIVPLIKMTDRALNSQWSSPTRATTLEELRAEVEILRQKVDRRA